MLVSVDNTDGKLAPYLTAKLSITVRDQRDAVVVPNAALSWQPAEHQFHPGGRDTYARLKANLNGTGEMVGQELGIVWLEQDGQVRPIQVRVGLRDAINTEILGGNLPAGTQVITGKAS